MKSKTLVITGAGLGLRTGGKAGAAETAVVYSNSWLMSSMVDVGSLKGPGARSSSELKHGSRVSFKCHFLF